MASLAARLPGVALVTGAGGTGIGAAVAKAFARSGCSRIAITDVNKETLMQTQASILTISPQAQVLSVDGDISDEKFVTSLAEQVATKFSRLDYAVNCAGILGPSLRSHETPVDVFDRLNRVNYRGSWLCSRAALGLMLKQEPLDEHPEQRGSIVNIASQLGIVARPSAAPYCASKAAIINMTRSDAIDYSQDGIRVNCVCPGVIESPMTTGSEEVTERLRPAVNIAPMRRMGRPDEVANAVLFLCSSQSSFVQGHALVVDGGYTIN
ncbi:NAD(P)-binding protein [Coniochaeta ligniaria NRRL 30616]|uniref:NAD(P)-binding protein n=1 Tax=Coniochaeta ligniaria NRRL 30616 TaxID=1408157 RepID=A0A1J7JV03_9PEZI|nr:NAD(P)-binding protein [Coniochaeta ligniaria NRRL 30616]